MKAYFYNISDYVFSLTKKDEVALCYFEGERTDFARLNKSKIRQNGFVNQGYLEMTLAKGKIHADHKIVISGDELTDKGNISKSIELMRGKMKFLPEDPYFIYSTNVNNTEKIKENKLPDSKTVLESVAGFSKGKDLAGIYSSGGIYAGFANSFGQKNWFEKYSFDFSWSVYHSDDKATKERYCGFIWDKNIFENKMHKSFLELAIVSKTPVTVKPGKYRAYLSPSALSEFTSHLGWRTFGLKKHKEKSSPLLKMTEEGRLLNSSVSIYENIKDGAGPDFLRTGFIKRPNVALIKTGKFNDYLVSPRSSIEYKVEHNGANSDETTTSVDMDAGNLEEKNILKELNTGIYMNNVWYLSVSDVMTCRLTGMTRFATFWVENGEIQAPLNVMRFNESLYDMLGGNLLQITKNKEFIMSDDSYFLRSTDSFNLPGILIKDFNFTL